jgi:hypothetical protein|uniref:hypothetical protein n=1 Tax=Prosthecobacter sp. TaxID=1965333 RepID=UPI0037849553
MDRIKGQVVEILAPNRVLFEIAFVGNYNKRNYADVVEVRFTDLTPPYDKDASGSEIIGILNNSILGVQASLQVQSKDVDGTLVGRLKLEGVAFRRKRKLP